MSESYIATTPLFVDGVRAHNPGDEVPEANVKANGWEDGVARASSKKAKDVTEGSA
jgi:hypothetical protein